MNRVVKIGKKYHVTLVHLTKTRKPFLKVHSLKYLVNECILHVQYCVSRGDVRGCPRQFHNFSVAMGQA